MPCEYRFHGDICAIAPPSPDLPHLPQFLRQLMLSVGLHVLRLHQLMHRVESKLFQFIYLSFFTQTNTLCQLTQELRQYETVEWQDMAVLFFREKDIYE